MSYRRFKKIFSLILVISMLVGGIPALAANDIKMTTNDNDIVNAIEHTSGNYGDLTFVWTTSGLKFTMLAYLYM